MSDNKLLSDEELKQAMSHAIDEKINGCDVAYLSKEEQDYQQSVVNAMFPLINTQKRLYAESVIDRIDTAYKYSSLEPDFTEYDAGKNRGLAIAVALLEGNEQQVIEDSAEQRERIK